jgi:hypothetical protein
LEKPRLVVFRFCETISHTSLLVWYEQETTTLKRQKLGLWLASRTKLTKAAVGNVLPKNVQFEGGAFQKKEKRFMENECLEQKLQLIQYEVFHPKSCAPKLAGLDS